MLEITTLLTNKVPGTSKKVTVEIFPQKDGIYDGTDTDQGTSPTGDENLEHNVPKFPRTAVGNMICVIARIPIALIITDTEIPVYQRNFPSIF